jgi:hypothetical protein
MVLVKATDLVTVIGRSVSFRFLPELFSAMTVPEPQVPEERRRALPPHDIPPAIGRPKLFGRAFYESIGSPKKILAPMVDQSEFVSQT